MKVVQAYAETVEFVPVTVTLNGSPVTAGVEFAALPEGARPQEADWKDADLLEGNAGVLISGLSAGYYWVWVRVTASPEIPVFVGIHIRIK